MYTLKISHLILVGVLVLASIIGAAVINKYTYDSRIEMKLNRMHHEIRMIRCHETGVYEYPS